MSEEKDPRIITPMPQALVDRIDDYRFKNRIPSRAEAIRCLTSLGIDAEPILLDLLRLMESLPDDEGDLTLHIARVRSALGLNAP